MGKPSMMNTKERLLHYLDKKGVNKSAFFKSVGLSRTNFTGTNLTKSLSSDALVKVLTHCPDLSAEWLMRGEGGMLRQLSKPVQRRGPLKLNVSPVGEAGKGTSSLLADVMQETGGALLKATLPATVDVAGVTPVSLPLRNKHLRREAAVRGELAEIAQRLNELLAGLESGR